MNHTTMNKVKNTNNNNNRISFDRTDKHKTELVIFILKKNLSILCFFVYSSKSYISDTRCENYGKTTLKCSEIAYLRRRKINVLTVRTQKWNVTMG